MTLTNIGSFPLSFTPAHSSLTGTGFSINLASKVKSLPGAPQYESIDFDVHFDPASVNCQLGHVEAVLPFQVHKFNVLMYHHIVHVHVFTIYIYILYI